MAVLGSVNIHETPVNCLVNNGETPVDTGSGKKFERKKVRTNKNSNIFPRLIS